MCPSHLSSHLCFSLTFPRLTGFYNISKPWAAGWIETILTLGPGRQNDRSFLVLLPFAHNFPLLGILTAKLKVFLFPVFLLQ